MVEVRACCRGAIAHDIPGVLEVQARRLVQPLQRIALRQIAAVDLFEPLAQKLGQISRGQATPDDLVRRALRKGRRGRLAGLCARRAIVIIVAVIIIVGQGLRQDRQAIG